MFSRENVLKIFNEKIKKYSDNFTIRFDTKLDEIKIDSLDLMYLFIDVEKEYDIFMDTDKLYELKTVGDVVDLVLNMLKKK